MRPTIRLSLITIAICLVSAGIIWALRAPISFWLARSLQADRIALQLNPHDPDLLMTIGNSFFGDGRIYDQKKAYENFSAVIRKDPSRVEAHYQLGRIYFINGQFESAITEIQTVLHLDPDFKKAYYMYGLVSGYKGDLDQAIWGFSEFIARDGFNWAGYNDLAWIHFKQGDYEKTKVIALRGLAHAPDNPWLQNTYGTALLNLGDPGQARTVFMTALATCEEMRPEDWGGAYPGNDPILYDRGLNEMCMTIRKNLSLLANDSRP